MTTSPFHLEKLLRDVFAPHADEHVTVMVDLPHDAMKDNKDWIDRRQMAEEWRLAFQKFGTRVNPLLSYPATGASNSDLPETGMMDGRQVRVADILNDSHIVVSMTQYSATAPLSVYVQRLPDFRAASMPNVLRRMEKSALAADYRQVAERTHLLADRLTRADEARIVFTTGHACTFDLRYRTGYADDGDCTREKKGYRLINLPSGEGFIVPYEGERPGEPSRTEGVIPLKQKDETILLHIKENRIATIEGAGTKAQTIRSFFEADPARRNVAELGLGCNEQAIVTGNVLEDEKAGVHWAYGRSEHLGGTVGPSAFLHTSNVIHHDIVYARGCPIGVTSLVLKYPDGRDEWIVKDSGYCIFPSD